MVNVIMTMSIMFFFIGFFFEKAVKIAIQEVRNILEEEKSL